CEPDSAKARKVSAVKERAVEELRQQNAKYECGEASKAEVRESALKDTISTRRRKGMSNEEFEDLWASALGEIQNVEEVVSGTDGYSAQPGQEESSPSAPPPSPASPSLAQSDDTSERHLDNIFGSL
ncbi:hypothetical protein KC318_g22033, partial [Hortaea werneckii]